ncbi:MAG: hypothetical protein HGB04_04150, partial [Chlorobiaceae bacterium]|nr:hypothetical protein [Chlorobiaceae bacterium]
MSYQLFSAGSNTWPTGETVNDSIKINGAVTRIATDGDLVYGSSGASNVIFGDSSTSGVADTLTLDANDSVSNGIQLGNIEIWAEIAGAISGESGEYLTSITITADGNVTFHKAVTIAGSMSITAGGTVTFAAGVTLLSGGSLTVESTGGTIKFDSGLSLDNDTTPGNALGATGNLLLKANEIDFGTGTISGTGTVTLLQETTSLAIAIGSPSDIASNSSAHLNLEAAELAKLSDGFTSIVIGANSEGHAVSTAGAVTIGADSSALFRDDVTIYGGSITVNDDSASQNTLTVSSGESLVLDAYANITIKNQVDATSVTLYSTTGSITSPDGASPDASYDTNLGETVIATSLIVTAATGIDLDTTVTNLQASNTTSGNISIHETNGLTVSNATTNSGGSISIDVDAGDLTVDAAVTAGGSGNITLNADGGATGGTVDLNAAVSSTSGAIVVTGDVVTQDANITTGSTGTVKVVADDGDITMSSGKETQSSAGSITYRATGDVKLSWLDSTSGGAVNVTADTDNSTSGSITDNLSSGSGDSESVNITTSGTATLVARAGIGTGSGDADIDTDAGTLAAYNSTSGDINIQEKSGLVIGSTTAVTNVVDAVTGVSTGNGNGKVSIDVDAGGLTVGSAVAANGSGTVTLNADGGTVAVSAAVGSSSGAIAVTGDAVTQSANITTGSSGTVTVTADTTSITMSGTSATTTSAGAIAYSAKSDVGVTQFSSTNGGTVTVTAD